MAGIPKPSVNVGKPYYTVKKKKKVDYVLVALVAIVLAIVLFSAASLIYEEELDDGTISGEPVGNGTAVDNNLTNNTVPDEESEEYLLGMAIASKDVAMCEELTTKKQDCYEALADDSEEACIKVEDYEKKKECILEHSEEKGSTILCKELNEADEEECGMLIDPCYGTVSGERELCLALANEDYVYCGDKDCLFEYVKQTKDAEACEVFEAPAETYACYSIVDDKNNCDELVFVAQQDYCYYLYGTLTDRSYYCAEISSDNVYAYMCYYEFSVKEGDYTYCLDLGDLNDRWECLKNYALATGDVVGCENIHELAEANYESCYFNYAIEHSLPEYCKKLQNPNSQDSCFAQSIQDMSKPLPPENCANITDESWIDNCYKYSAWKNEDLTICEEIVNENTHTTCTDWFEEES